MRRLVLPLVVAAGLLLIHPGIPTPFQIRVVDRAGRPLRGVTLRADDGWSYTTNDVGAYVWRPDMMRRDVTFHIDGDGSTTLHVTPGGHADVVINR